MALPALLRPPVSDGLCGLGLTIHLGDHRDHRIQEVLVMEYRECRRCHQNRPVSEFHKCSKRSDGLQTWCHSCINKYKLQWRAEKRTPKERNAHSRINENRELFKHGLKRCHVCWEVKPLDDYHASSEKGGTADKVFGTCAECRNQLYPRSNRPEHETEEEKEAHQHVRYATERGYIIRPKECPICHAEPRVRIFPRIQFHHTDGYDKAHWYTGIFICARCHSKIHKGELHVIGTNWLL